MANSHNSDNSEPLLSIPQTSQIPWSFFSAAIEHICIHTKLTAHQFSTLYTMCYDICVKKTPTRSQQQQQLYEQIQHTVQEHLEKTHRQIIIENEKLLQTFIAANDKFLTAVQVLSNVFRYVDRYYVPRNNKHTIKQVCTQLFRTVVVMPLEHAITEVLVKRSQENQWTPDQCIVIQKTLEICHQSDDGQTRSVYSRMEQKIVNTIVTLYQSEAAKQLQQLSSPEYLKYAEQCITMERQRCRRCFHHSNEADIMDGVEKALAVACIDDILSKPTGLAYMVVKHHQDGATNDLQRLFRLYEPFNSCLAKIAKLLSEIIVAYYEEELSKLRSSRDMMPSRCGPYYKDYIELLLSCHASFAFVIRECFQDNSMMKKALADSFAVIVNKCSAEGSTAELLVLYVNHLLVTHSQIRSHRINFELQQIFYNVILIFNSLYEKDFFIEIYRYHLSVRLLVQNSNCFVDEHAMIGLFKAQTGAVFTQRLEVMLSDMSNQENLNNCFQSYCRKHHLNVGIDLAVQVLQYGSWPSNIASTDDVMLPNALALCQNAFKQFYTSVFSNRKLNFAPAIGTVVLTVHAPDCSMEIICSTEQAAILMLFTDCINSLSIGYIQNTLKLSSVRLKQNLRILLKGRYKILKKTPYSGYSETHTVCINHNILQNTKECRIRLPVVFAHKPEAIHKVATRCVAKYSRLALEAAIVRTMKHKRILHTSKLIAEITSILNARYKINLKTITDAIDDLVEREYLVRGTMPDQLLYQV